ncbi:MAG: YdcF family protein [Acidobacteria bacterium]|nr:YdcF family protein [Acidobacteriota bacterium]
MAFNLQQFINRKGLRRWAGRAVLALLAWSLLAWIAARALIVRADLARADVLVMLSGGSFYPERVRHTADLFAQGRASKIILTDDGIQGPWSFEKERNPSYAEIEAEALQRAGVQAENIEIIPQRVSTTYDEAVRVRDYAQGKGLRSVLVVTSPYHSRRALWVWQRVFRESGIHVGLDPAPTGQQSPPPATWWWHWRGWLSVAYEYPKLVYYWLNYS